MGLAAQRFQDQNEFLSQHDQPPVVSASTGPTLRRISATRARQYSR
jgi:hypothetical protein